jgi:hypothetical protein
LAATSWMSVSTCCDTIAWVMRVDIRDPPVRCG